MRKVLITGGNGFIGSHLAEKLEERGDSVALLDLGFNSNTERLGCEKTHGDVTDYSAVKDAVEGKDAVFHLAAVSRVAWGEKDPFTCWRTNVLGTLNVLEACRKAETNPILFYASSREVYGEPLYLPVNETHPENPVSVYGMSKLAAEKACQAYSGRHGDSRPVNQMVFRFSNVYGSRRDLPERVIPKFMMKALLGEEITLFGGEQILDFTFIDDTVEGILKAYDASLDDRSTDKIFGQDFHFVTGRGISVANLARTIIDLADSPSKVIRTNAKGFDVRRFVGDPTKSRQAFGFETRVKLEDGLKILREEIAPTIEAS